MSLYTRRLIQLDFEMYGETDAYGKRHFIEPDFGVIYLVILLRIYEFITQTFIYIRLLQVHAIAGGDCWNPELFRQQFTGPHLKYNVSKCENVRVQILLSYISVLCLTDGYMVTADSCFPMRY